MAKVQVSERALLARINRKLAKQDQKVCRGRRVETEDGYLIPADHNLGWYYSIDIRHNCIVAKDQDLETVGRELGVLKGWEELVEEA